MSTGPLAEPRSFAPPGWPVLAGGQYSAPIVCLSPDAGVARALLPRGLELAPQAMTPAGRHPVMLLFGHHRAVRTRLLPFTRLDYLEAVVAVPYVRRPGDAACGRGPFTFMPVLYLNDWLAVVLGWFYAYDKRRARVAADAETYRVASLWRGTPLLSGRFTPRGAAGRPADFPLFDAVRPTFEQPFIGQTIVGSFLCSDLAFHLEDASIRPLAGEVRIESPFLPALVPAVYELRGIDEAPLGAFLIQVPWTLSAPYGCSRGRSGPPVTGRR